MCQALCNVLCSQLPCVSVFSYILGEIPNSTEVLKLLKFQVTCDGCVGCSDACYDLLSECDERAPETYSMWARALIWLGQSSPLYTGAQGRNGLGDSRGWKGFIMAGKIGRAHV